MKRHKNQNRHRKHIPYGSKGYCGIGGETYSHKYGYIVDDIVDKKGYRQKIRKLLKDIDIKDFE